MTKVLLVPDTSGPADPLLDDLASYLTGLRRPAHITPAQPLHHRSSSPGVMAVLQMLEELYITKRD
ncbi:hypothetical protein AAIH70_29120 [Neorhizobium sp. BT27B]|uniref:hypothetical protein n=1 Tax=Neorhizobium sp. BT27B TaxID=3142625 RepID=UPI003D2B3AFC